MSIVPNGDKRENNPNRPKQHIKNENFKIQSTINKHESNTIFKNEKLNPQSTNYNQSFVRRPPSAT